MSFKIDCNDLQQGLKLVNCYFIIVNKFTFELININSMSDFNQYDENIALYNSSLKVKSAPIYCWDFNFNFLEEVRNFYLDLNKLDALATRNKWSHSWDLKDSLKEEVIIVTDSKLKIVFASHNIVGMNGYSATEVIGKSPRMFQGEETNAEVSNEIRNAIIELKPFKKTILNYKKNGETYECLIRGFPVFNSKGLLSHYIAFEKAA